MYAVIETGGKQIRVEEGQQIWVEKLDVEEGAEVVFDKVLLMNGNKLVVGSPYVEGAKVSAEGEKQGKGKKVVIYKYRPRSGSSHRKQGHRQPYTRLVIKSINA